MSTYTQSHRKYYEEHKDKVKEYYEEHKESILERMKERVECGVCGKTVSRGNLRQHQKSKKCMASLDDPVQATIVTIQLHTAKRRIIIPKSKIKSAKHENRSVS